MERLAPTRKIGDRRGEGITLGNIGQIYTCNGHNLRFQCMAAEHGVEALDVLGAGRVATGVWRLAA